MSSFSSNGTSVSPLPTLKSLDLADEDAVHQAAHRIGSLGVVAIEPAPFASLVERDLVAGIEDDVLDPHPLETFVACQFLDREHALHGASPSCVETRVAECYQSDPAMGAPSRWCPWRM